MANEDGRTSVEVVMDLIEEVVEGGGHPAGFKRIEAALQMMLVSGREGWHYAAELNASNERLLATNAVLAARVDELHEENGHLAHAARAEAQFADEMKQQRDCYKGALQEIVARVEGDDKSEWEIAVAALSAGRETEVLTKKPCDNKDQNGVCKLHNLHCGYPYCEQ